MKYNNYIYLNLKYIIIFKSSYSSFRQLWLFCFRQNLKDYHEKQKSGLMEKWLIVMNEVEVEAEDEIIKTIKSEFIKKSIGVINSFTKY